jgi:hypothetical protein
VGRLRFVVLLAALAVIAGCGGGQGHGIRSAPDSTTTSSQATTASGPAARPATRLSPRLKRMLRSPQTPTAEVRGLVKGVLVLGGAATCGPRVVTPRYVKTGYGSHEGCIEATRSRAGVADGIEFKAVRIEGNHATVVVIPAGGTYDAERVTVSLVRDRRWAIDRLDADVPVGP